MLNHKNISKTLVTMAVLAMVAVFSFTGVAQAAFVPSDIASVTAWFDASDLSKLSLDGGNEVNSWTDSTTSPITASASGSVRPTYDAAGFGAGLPGLSFDGSNDALSSAVGAANDAKFTTAANFFAVAKRTALESTAGGDTVIAYGSSGGGSNTNYIWQIDRGATGASAISSVYAGSGWRDGSTDVDTSAHILELSFSTSGGYAFYIDGVAAGTDGNTTAWSGSPSPNQFFLGKQQTVNHWNGLLGDLVLSDEVLSLDDRNKVGEYLETLYGLDTAYEADLGGGGAVPEPSTLFLSGIGLLGLLACGRRRNRRRA